MNVETLSLYELYFRKHKKDIFMHELLEHHCSFCSLEVNTKVLHCKTDVAKVILEYLNHSRLVTSPSWKKMKYFFKSVTISGFFDDNILGKWKMVKWEEKDIYILCQLTDDDKNCIYFN